MDGCLSMAHNLHGPLSAVAKGLFAGSGLMDPRLAMATLDSLRYLPNLVDKQRLHHANFNHIHPQDDRPQVNLYRISFFLLSLNL